MTHGKNICNQLKEVRKRIAEENDIPLETEECTYKGECRGTCPRCEAVLQPCNAQCNGARPIYTTARGFCNGARRNCTETANFRRPAGNKKRRAALVSMINYK